MGKEYNKENVDKDDVEIMNGGVNKDINVDGEKGEWVVMKIVIIVVIKMIIVSDELLKNLMRDMLEKI